MRTAFTLVFLFGASACNTPSATAPDAGVDSAVERDGDLASDSATDAAVEDGGSPIQDGGQDAALPPGDAGPPPSDELVAMYDSVIVPHCGGGDCHAPGTNESSYFGYAPRLQMPDPATARAVLVDRPVDCISSTDSRIRVVPFDPAASAIMTVAEDGLCGRRHNIVVPDLTADDLAIIERWIAAGAP
jgi:hypothetical protein